MNNYVDPGEFALFESCTFPNRFPYLKKYLNVSFITALRPNSRKLIWYQVDDKFCEYGIEGAVTARHVLWFENVA
jgi:hypothetical protein